MANQLADAFEKITENEIRVPIDAVRGTVTDTTQDIGSKLQAILATEDPVMEQVRQLKTFEEDARKTMGGVENALAELVAAFPQLQPKQEELKRKYEEERKELDALHAKLIMGPLSDFAFAHDLALQEVTQKIGMTTIREKAILAFADLFKHFGPTMEAVMNSICDTQTFEDNLQRLDAELLQKAQSGNGDFRVYKWEEARTRYLQKIRDYADAVRDHMSPFSAEGARGIIGTVPSPDEYAALMNNFSLDKLDPYYKPGSVMQLKMNGSNLIIRGNDQTLAERLANGDPDVIALRDLAQAGKVPTFVRMRTYSDIAIAFQNLNEKLMIEGTLQGGSHEGQSVVINGTPSEAVDILINGQPVTGQVDGVDVAQYVAEHLHPGFQLKPLVVPSAPVAATASAAA